MKRERMGWGESPFTPPLREPDRYHELPEIVITGEGPKSNWVPLLGIGAAALAVLFLAGRK